jgi:hypothetical protein
MLIFDTIIFVHVYHNEFKMHSMMKSAFGRCLILFVHASCLTGIPVSKYLLRNNLR